MICSILVCGSCESRSSSVKKSVNNSEFISRSGLHLLIWSRRTSPGCWRTCSTRCLEGCTRDSWWWFAAGRQWKASWSHSIYSSVSLSWSSGLWGQKRRRARQSMWINSNLMNSLCVRRNNVIRKTKKKAALQSKRRSLTDGKADDLVVIWSLWFFHWFHEGPSIRMSLLK